MQNNRVPGTCCRSPGCDKWDCTGCEYITVCKDDPQKIDYCPRPHICTSCDASCLYCDLWKAPVIRPYSEMTEGEALRKMIDSGFKKEDILFVGDALFPGGNDYPVKKEGVDVIEVKDPEETKEVIRNLLKEMGEDAGSKTG